MGALLIDAFDFCRLHERREGEVQVAALPRLAMEAADASGALRWSLQGGSNMHGHPQLAVTVTGSVQLICQRCLTPLAFAIDSKSVLVLAANEALADEIDAFLADEAVEVIVGSRALDVAGLIEDDALLALPLAPKHETCPDQLAPPAQTAAGMASPFSVLKDLKR